MFPGLSEEGPAPARGEELGDSVSVSENLRLRDLRLRGGGMLRITKGISSSPESGV